MIVNFDEFNSIPGIFYHQANDLKGLVNFLKKLSNKEKIANRYNGTRSI